MLRLQMAGFLLKKFLYLTNKQAASFNSANMDTVMYLVRAEGSSLRYRLLPSTGGRAQREAHTESGELFGLVS